MMYFYPLQTSVQNVDETGSESSALADWPILGRSIISNNG